MSYSYNSFPGIAKIFCVDSFLLPNAITYKADANLPVALLTDVHPINFVQHPNFSCDSEYINNANIFHTKLEFSSISKLDFKNYKLAFIVQGVNGESLLIGTKEPPFPIVKESHSLGNPNGDQNMYSYEISWVSTAAPANIKF